MLVILNFITWVVVLSFLTYLIINNGKELIADLKHPYLGFASTYLFNHFIAGFLAIFLMLHCGLILLNERALDFRIILFFNSIHIFSIYNGVLFIIKKYNFTKIKNEIILTALLQILCYLSIIILNCLPQLRINNDLTVKSYSEILYLLFSSLGNVEYFPFSNNLILNIIFFLKTIPLVILFSMWTHSIGKEYNKKTNSYFVKSANHSILFFLIYEILLSSLPFIRFSGLIELTAFIILIFITKTIFSKKILFWLRHKDMEAIETNAILRSKK